MTLTADQIDAHVGRRLRLLREAKRISQTTLGEAIGVSFQQVQKYERGTNRLSASALVLASEALGIAPAALLEGLGDDRAAPLFDPLALSLAALSPKGRNLVADLVDSMARLGV